MLSFLPDWLIARGVDPRIAAWSATAAHVVLVAILAWITDQISRRLLAASVRRLAARSTTHIDDLLVQRRVFRRLAHLAPAAVVYLAAPVVLGAGETSVVVIQHACLIYMVVVGILVADGAVSATLDAMSATAISRDVPLRSVAQVLKLVLYCLGVIVVLSLLLGKSPVLLVSGLGAMTAVLMLIFKDAILGFVAGIQLAANRMVAPGDWIEMPQFGADGDVLEVGLTTVKVQNWDKTITTIPTYALISGSFKNWRGMDESGGRRMKRSINIDMRSVTFCDDEMLERFRKIEHMAEYLDRQLREVEAWNAERGITDESPVNGRRLTNLGTFRAYLVEYLRHHPKIRPDMTMLVRELAPTPHGIPVEIYAFSNDQRWAHYESILADIIDHLLASVPEFDLRVYQDPSGNDLDRLRDLAAADPAR